MDINDLTGKVINCAIEVHKTLGPGLLESAYKQCLAYELSKAGISFKLEYDIPVVYKDKTIACGYRIDILVDDRLILELKSVDKIIPVHSAQILTYMRLSEINMGLRINFNTILLKNGIKRFIL